MVVIEIPIRSYPKPAGAQGYNGKITMMGSRGGKYGAWTVKAKKAIIDLYSNNDAPMPQNIAAYGIVYHFMMADKKCGDILNIAGSITDVLVKLGIITDDSPRYMPRVAAGVYFEKYTMIDGTKYLTKIIQPSIKIILCHNQEDWRRAANPL